MCHEKDYELERWGEAALTTIGKEGLSQDVTMG